MAIKKEILLLQRDPGGVAVLFIMPLILIIAVTLIQDSAFKSATNTGIPVLVVDLDHGDVSKEVISNLKSSAQFELITSLDGATLTESTARDAVFKGRYQLAIIIPEGLSRELEVQISKNVSELLTRFGLEQTETERISSSQKKEVRLYFDPAVQMNFKASVVSNIDKMISKIETQSIYKAFEAQLGEEVGGLKRDEFISFKEISPDQTQAKKPNAVQHNVPAWTLFAMFFIVIPLSINLVKEKNLGTYIRTRTNPGARTVAIFGKMIAYLIICMLQFYMMIAIAVFLFPHLNLPPLNIESHLVMMSIVALFSGFAAIGFGLLLGTMAKTQEQSAPFGATATIILAAIGGVWVPVFAMPDAMQVVARSSPMNWGLNAFYDVLLRDADLIEILPEIGLLFGFFLLTTIISLLYDKKKRAV